MESLLEDKLFFCKMCYPLKIKTIVNLLLLLLTLILRGRDNLKMYSHMNTDKKHVLIEVVVNQRWRVMRTLIRNMF